MDFDVERFSKDSKAAAMGQHISDPLSLVQSLTGVRIEPAPLFIHQADQEYAWSDTNGNKGVARGLEATLHAIFAVRQA